MSVHDFAALVQRMRQAQKDYFAGAKKSNSRRLLEEARDLERRVDAVCFDVLEGQKDLFGGGTHAG